MAKQTLKILQCQCFEWKAYFIVCLLTSSISYLGLALFEINLQSWALKYKTQSWVIIITWFYFWELFFSCIPFHVHLPNRYLLAQSHWWHLLSLYLIWTDFTHCSSISIAYLHWASQRWLVTRWKIYSYVKIVYLSALHFRLYSYLNTICNLQSSLSTKGRLLWEKRVFMLYHRLKYIGWTVHRN